MMVVLYVFVRVQPSSLTHSYPEQFCDLSCYVNNADLPIYPFLGLYSTSPSANSLPNHCSHDHFPYVLGLWLRHIAWAISTENQQHFLEEEQIKPRWDVISKSWRISFNKNTLIKFIHTSGY